VLVGVAFYAVVTNEVRKVWSNLIAVEEREKLLGDGFGMK